MLPVSSLVPQNNRSDATDDVALGTAAWMVPDEARSRFEFDDRFFTLNASGLWEGRSAGQVWLGEAIDSAAGALGYTDDRHVCLVSGTRGGKGTGILIPNLCLWSGSCIVIDPKGENATVTALRRGTGSEYSYGLGQNVRILDPFGEVQLDPSLKAKYNPLDAIDPAGDHAVDDAGRVAAALVVVESRTDPYWEEAARDLIKGLILHVLTDADFEGRRNLVSVWRLLNQGDWIYVELVRAAGEKNVPSGFDLLWEGMKRNKAYNGLVAGLGEQFAGMAERTRSSILGSARGSLEFISGPPMQRLLESSDFDLAGLKTDPRGLTLYLTLPQRYMSTHYRWLRLMVSLAVGEMERIRGRPATGHPTLFVLDEFAGLKRMEVIEHAAAQAAGFGAKFLFVVQNLTQLKEHYKDSWETFLGNSGLKFFFQIEDDFTRSYVTRQLGEHEVRRSTRSGSQSQSTSRSVTDGSSQSVTRGTSTSSTDGKSGGSSTGRTRGSSNGSSRNYEGPFGMFKTGEGDNAGSNQSTTRTGNKGWSSSESTSLSRSRSSSTSSSQSTSTSESVTDGWSEAVHKRSLLNPDEVGRLFARVDERTDPAYPGVMLALTPGRHPLIVRRVNYFESPKFAGFFDPHPDHPVPPTLAERAAALRRTAAEIEIEPIEYRPEQTTFWQKKRSRKLHPVITVGVPILVAIIIVVLGIVVLPQYQKEASRSAYSYSPSQAVSSSVPTQATTPTAPSIDRRATTETAPTGGTYFTAPPRPPIQDTTSSAAVSSAFRDGLEDRRDWEKWFSGLSGDKRDGAEYWANNRNKDNRECFDKQANATFYYGCRQAKVLLDPIDHRRNAEADYWRGWNSF